MYDVVVIGAGPAGISSSLYITRGGLKVLVIYSGISNVEKAHIIENYYGFVGGISGIDLYNKGIEQAKLLGVDFVENQVIGIEYAAGGYLVKTPIDAYPCKGVVIATGNKKKSLNIPGIKEYEGKGVSYCAICDAFFYKNKKVVVIGNGEFALDEAKTLSNVASNVTILTNGLDKEFKDDKFNINKLKIKEIVGKDTVTKIIFEDDTEFLIDGIFIALGEAGALDFAKTLGIFTDKDTIKVDSYTMATNVPGIYACGNITGGLLQVSKAVYEGTVAGLSLIKYVKGEK